MKDLLAVMIGSLNQAISYFIIGFSPLLFLIASVIVASKVADGDLKMGWLVAVLVAFVITLQITCHICKKMLHDNEEMDAEEIERWSKHVSRGNLFVLPIAVGKCFLEVKFPEDRYITRRKKK